MKENFNWDFPYPSRRMPILAKNIVSIAQAIYKLDDGYLGASDWRKDGQATGF